MKIDLTRRVNLLSDSKPNIFADIKTKGYWKILIRPNSFPEERIPLPKLRDIIDECQVRQRGWYFPVIDARNGETFFGDDFLTSNVCWNEFIEIWRFYQSGQFISYMGLSEDRFKQKPYSKGKYLDVILSLYSITEFFIFAKNLASKKIMGDNIQIKITLSNTLDRTLIINDIFRHLNRDYTCKVNELIIFDGSIPFAKLLADYDKIALETTMNLFNKFSWLNPDMENVLKNDQEKLLKRVL